MALVRFQRRPQRAAFPALPAFAGAEELENRMRKFFDEGLLSFDGDLLPQTIGWMPATDVAETPEALTLTAELPGLDRTDVDITVDDGMLTIRGEKADERTVEDKKYHVVERMYGSFQRSFALPRTVDASKINAEFGKGVLTIVMPKTTEAKTKGRKIEVADQKIEVAAKK
ncbi:MAG: Hsp20/alpha crystallin family protein [bacterium]